MLKNSPSDETVRISFGVGHVISSINRKKVGSARPSLSRHPGLINKRKDIPQPSITGNQWRAAFWDWTSKLNSWLTTLGLTGTLITNHTGLLTFSYTS